MVRIIRQWYRRKLDWESKTAPYREIYYAEWDDVDEMRMLGMSVFEISVKTGIEEHILWKHFRRLGLNKGFRRTKSGLKKSPKPRICYVVHEALERNDPESLFNDPEFLMDCFPNADKCYDFERLKEADRKKKEAEGVC
jgi:hypothetical protein